MTKALNRAKECLQTAREALTQRIAARKKLKEATEAAALAETERVAAAATAAAAGDDQGDGKGEGADSGGDDPVNNVGGFDGSIPFTDVQLAEFALQDSQFDDIDINLESNSGDDIDAVGGDETDDACEGGNKKSAAGRKKNTISQIKISKGFHFPGKRFLGDKPPAHIIASDNAW